LTENETKGMRFVNAGIKMFVKQDVQGQNTCPWRIQTDGLNLIEPWVDGNRVIRLNKKDTLKKLLIEMFIKVSGEDWMKLGEISEAVRDMGMGCAILIIESNPDDPDGFTERMVMPIWRGISSVNLMLPKEDRKAYLLRLYNDESPLIDHSNIIYNRKLAAKQQEEERKKAQKPKTAEDGQTSSDDDSS